MFDVTKIDWIKCGDALEIFSKTARAEVMKKIKKLMRDGHRARFSDGTEEWFDDRMVINENPERPSDRYQWNASGDKVRHVRTHWRKDSQGRVQKVSERTVYKAF